MNGRYLRRLLFFMCFTGLVCACSNRVAPTPAEQASLALEELRSTIDEELSDEPTQVAVLNLLADLNAEINAAGPVFSQRRAQIRQLNADYDATREEMMELLEEATTDIAGFRSRLLALRGRLAANTTPEQREKIQDAEAKAASAIADSLLVL